MSEAPGSAGAPTEKWLRYLAIAVLVLVGIVLAWSRLIHLDNSVWHDEAESILTYNQFDTLIDAKSSHVLFNVLSWLTTKALGGSEAVQRLWSVVPALAAVALATWWAWRRIGILTAVVFAVLAMASPMHLDLAAQARGYGLALLAATAMLVAADALTRERTKATVLAFLGAGLVGTWTLIFFAFAFVGQALSLLWWPQLRRTAAVVLAAVVVLSIVFYIPVLDSGDNLVDTWNAVIPGQRISLGAAVFLERSLEWLVIPTVTLLSGPPTGDAVGHRLAAGWVDTVALLALLGGLVALWRRGQSGLALLLVVPPLFFNLAFSVLGLNTEPRHQLLLMPYVLIPVATGIAALGTLLARPRWLRPIVIAIGVVAVLVLARETIKEEEVMALPRENFKAVAEIVRGTGIDTVVTDSIRPAGLQYYLGDDLEVVPRSRIEDLLCDRRRDVVYIEHLPLPPWFNGYRKPADVRCAIERGASRVRVPQRGRGFAIDVWIAPGRHSRQAEEPLPYAPR